MRNKSITTFMAAMLLTACAQATAPSAAPSANNAAKPAAQTADQPQKGGTAIIVIDTDPTTLNGGITTEAVAGQVAAKIFNALVYLDKDYAPQPQLAEKWDVSPDGKVYTFKLRSGVTFHDGKPLTSADVKFTYEEVLGKYHPRTQNLVKQRIDAIETPDATTVIFKLKDPYAPFLIQQTVFEAPILPKHLYEGKDVLKNEFNAKPIGSGPFKFGEWNRGQSITLVRNPAYFEKDLPYLDGIKFQMIPEAQNRAVALELGEADFIGDFYTPKTDVPRLAKNEKLVQRRGSVIPAIYFIMINTQSPAFKTAEARQALAFAIDRNRMVQQAAGGIGRPGRYPFGDGFKWLLTENADYDKLYPRDINKAKALLTTAGVTPGKLRLAYDSSRPQMIAGGQIIRENLKEIGFDVELLPMERTVMVQKVFADREFDITMQSFVSSGDPAIGYHRLYQTNNTKNQFTNATGYSNATVDDLMNKAAATPNRDERAKLYKQMQEIVVKDLPSIVLFDDEAVDTASKKLGGVFPVLDERDGWQYVWLKK